MIHMIQIGTGYNQNDLKAFCVSKSFFRLLIVQQDQTQIVQEISTLFELIQTNVLHKYSSVSLFANDISDHCVAPTVRNTKIPKT